MLNILSKFHSYFVIKFNITNVNEQNFLLKNKLLDFKCRFSENHMVFELSLLFFVQTRACYYYVVWYTRFRNFELTFLLHSNE